MATEHSFKIEDAVKYGVESATILYNLRFWLDKNKANNHNIHDGRVWTYNTQEAWGKLFPYLTRRQIQKNIKKLADDGILLKGNYNKNRFDKTVWYSLNEAQFETENYTTENDEIGLQPSNDRLHDMVQSTARDGAIDRPKRCNVTDNKQTDKNLSKSVNNAREADFSLDKIVIALHEIGMPKSENWYAKRKAQEYMERFPDSVSVADACRYVVNAIDHAWKLEGKKSG